MYIKLILFYLVPCTFVVFFFSKKGFLILMLLIISTIFYAMNETQRSTVNFLSFVLAWLLVVASHLVN